MGKLRENYIFDTRYRLISKLGEGGYSEVWMAEDISTQVVLVLKVFLHSSKLGEYGVKSFRKEFALVYNLNHTNLIKYSYFGICVGYPYLVMPYYESGSAEKLIGDCDEHTAWQFLRDVASGLSCLHKHKPAIIHQDIKPSNVLWDGQQYLITDFGISESLARKVVSDQNGDANPEQASDTSVGTKPYMAPERFSQAEPLRSSDIWSLGASLYEILSGKLPYGDEGGKAQSAGAILQPLPSTYSWELRNIIYRCLSFDPKNRPYADDIFHFASTQMEAPFFKPSFSPSVPPTPLISSSDGKKKKNRLKLLLIPAFFLVLIVALFLWKAEQNKNREPLDPYISNIDSILYSDPLPVPMKNVAKKTNKDSHHLELSETGRVSYPKGGVKSQTSGADGSRNLKSPIDDTFLNQNPNIPKIRAKDDRDEMYLKNLGPATSNSISSPSESENINQQENTAPAPKPQEKKSIDEDTTVE